MIFFLINFVKGSYQDELDHYFKTLGQLAVAARVVSKSALCKARKKLKYWAFIELNQHLTRFFYEKFQYSTWKGFNLIAIDGTTIRLPRTKEVAEHFGTWNPKVGAPCPLAKVSQMFDVLNKVTIDAIISPKENFDLELAAQHFLNLMPEDLVLMDRGYPAFWLFNLLLDMGANFCARISYNKWKIVNRFYKSAKRESIISLKPTYGYTRKYQEMGPDTQPLRLRLIRVELHTGETEILITSLIDKKAYPYEIFSDLYHLRWPVEEDYKMMKCRIEIENFSGKSVLSVYQDFHAKVFSKNLTAILAHPMREAIKKNTQSRKYHYQINFTQALSKMKDTIVLLFSRAHTIVKSLISGLHQILIQTIEPVRPGRKLPRKHKIKRRDFYPCYKPIR